jgi:hypothetical protein
VYLGTTCSEYVETLSLTLPTLGDFCSVTAIRTLWT